MFALTLRQNQRRRVWLPAILLVCFGAAGILGTVAYYRTRHEPSFREAPAETPDRPIVPGPGKELPAVTVARDPRFLASRPTPSASSNSVASLVWEAEWVNSISGSLECMPAEDAGGSMAVWAVECTGRNHGSRFRPDSLYRLSHSWVY